MGATTYNFSGYLVHIHGWKLNTNTKVSAYMFTYVYNLPKNINYFWNLILKQERIPIQIPKVVNQSSGTQKNTLDGPRFGRAQVVNIFMVLFWFVFDCVWS